MNRFVVISFLILGWVFYEVSGGADFTPGRVARDSAPGPHVTAKDTVIAPQVVVPKPVKVTTVGTTPKVTRISPVIAPAASVPTPQPSEIAPTGPDAPTDTAIIAPTPSPVSLASLERGETLFATRIDSNAPTTPVMIPAPISAPEPPAADIRAVLGRRVNMREGPGTRFPVLASLSRGARVEILDDPGSGWVRLRPLDGGPTGWMASSLIGAAAE